MTARYDTNAPTRAELDAMPGPVVVQFGTDWCGWCQGAEPHVAAAFAAHSAREPAVRHLRVEDGKGRPLGRSFGVRLWPTLVFLVDGREVARVVRPGDAKTIGEALAEMAAAGRSDG